VGRRDAGVAGVIAPLPLPAVLVALGIDARVGAWGRAVVDGETGFWSLDEDGWVQALERLVADPGLRATMGAAGRRRVEERYSVKVRAPRFEKVLRDAVGAV